MDLEEIISRTRKHIKGGISLFTNGFFLESRAKSLREEGLDKINISLHSYGVLRNNESLTLRGDGDLNTLFQNFQ